MRTIIINGFVALAVIISLCSSACNRKKAPTAAPTAQSNREPRPQGPEYRAGKIEANGMMYFWGHLDSRTGKIDLTQTNDGNQLYPGSAVAESDNGMQVSFEQDVADPCVRDGQLPLYLVKLGAQNLCSVYNEEYDLSDAEDQKACGGRGSQIFGHAVAIPGWWDERAGVYHRIGDPKGGARDVFTFACISGISAKCAHWGYLPWLKYQKNAQKYDASTGVDLQPYYVACARAARADYTATGTPMTCDHTWIDIADDLGIRNCALSDFPKLDAGVTDAKPTLESVWGVGAGAPTCVRRTRYDHCNNVVADPRCDVDYDTGSCPPANADWPAGGGLRIYSPQYTRGAICPTQKEDCK